MVSTLINYIEKELVGEALNLTEESDLLSTGLLDSLSIMRLINYVEEEFDVKIPAEEMVIENFMTVGAIKEYISSKK